MRRHLTILAVLAGVGLIAPRLARAEKPEIEALIKKGVGLRKQGKDQEALAVFKDAHAQSRSMQALAQVGLAQQALGQWLEAETSLSEALASADPWVAKRKQPLSAALSEVRGRLGSLDVLGPAGAEITVNGEPKGALPLERPIRVVAGSVTLEARLEGSWPLSRTIDVPANGLARETVKLTPKPVAQAPTPEPAPVAPAAPLPSPGPGKTEPAKAAPVKTEPAVTAHAGGASGPGVWPWVALGAGAVGIGVGIVGVILHNSHASTWNSVECTPQNGATREETCADERSAAESGSTLATIGFIGGGVGIAAAGALFFLLRPGEHESTALTVRPAGDLGLAIETRF
ncbi:MAG: hypothetical protein IT384_28060 [Deltaproteobacteria bacterium]|nr:hypothetical protein [Deltaproteobacteria bacterium]